MDGLTVWRLIYTPGDTKETATMMTTPETSAAQRAEQAGHAIASSFADALYAARDQSEAFRALKSALNAAFNDDQNAIIDAVADGFAVGIVNILERGIQAIKAD